ncbi:unnamed protein product [Ectocarpus sp. 4 AP-2014]
MRVFQIRLVETEEISIGLSSINERHRHRHKKPPSIVVHALCGALPTIHHVIHVIFFQQEVGCRKFRFRKFNRSRKGQKTSQHDMQSDTTTAVDGFTKLLSH